MPLVALLSHIGLRSDWMATWDAPIVGAGPVNCERQRMKVLINSTAILSLTLYVVPPFAAQAQDLPMADVGGQAVICLPDDQAACEDGATCVIAGPEDCQTTAEAAIRSRPEITTETGNPPIASVRSTAVVRWASRVTDSKPGSA